MGVVLEVVDRGGTHEGTGAESIGWLFEVDEGVEDVFDACADYQWHLFLVLDIWVRIGLLFILGRSSII